jgi:hypothetical protein
MHDPPPFFENVVKTFSTFKCYILIDFQIYYISGCYAHQYQQQERNHKQRNNKN